MLCLILLLCFSACGDKSETPGDKNNTNNTPGDSISLPAQSDEEGNDTMTDSDIKLPDGTVDGADTDFKGEALSPVVPQNKPITSRPASSGGDEEESHTHKWQPATCLAPKTCTICGETEGEKGSHKYENGRCVYCNQKQPAETYADYINYRGYNESLSGNKYNGALANTYKKLATKKELNVVYFGGSVTLGNGTLFTTGYKESWRVRIGEWLTNTFPNVKINNINRALGDTATTLALYRLDRDVLSKKPDLLFIEFSINDFYEDLNYTTSSMQFESIIRAVKQELPECDIVAVLVTEKSLIGDAHSGTLHLQAQAHEYICKKYNISSIHVGRALSDTLYKIGGGSVSDELWFKYIKDSVHPLPVGYEIYYSVIKEFLENTLLNSDYGNIGVVKQKLPTSVNPKLLPTKAVYINDDDPNVSFTTEDGTIYFKDEPSSSDHWDDGNYKGYIYFKAGSRDTVTVKFTGTELVMVATPLSTRNRYEYSLDGGKTWTVKQYSRKNPVPVVSGLKSGEHTVIIRPALVGEVNVDHFFAR